MAILKQVVRFVLTLILCGLAGALGRADHRQAQVAPSTFYAINPATRTLCTLDLQNQNVIPVAALALDFWGLTYDGVHDQIYALGDSGNGTSLYSLNRYNGHALFIGQLNVGSELAVCLAYDRSSNALYMIASDDVGPYSAGSLYRVDPTTAQASLLARDLRGYFGLNSRLIFSLGGVLYVEWSSGSLAGLSLVDKETGKVTFLGGAVLEAQSISLDPQTGSFYGVYYYSDAGSRITELWKSDIYNFVDTIRSFPGYLGSLVIAPAVTAHRNGP